MDFLLPLFAYGRPLGTVLIPILLVVVAWRSVRMGVSALILLWPAYLLRTSLFGIPTTALELSIYGVALGAVLRGLLRGGYLLPRLPRWILVLTGAWIVAWTLSTLSSADQQASLGALKAWLVDPLIFAWLLSVAARSVDGRQQLLKAVALSGAVVAIAGLIQVVAYRETLQDGRLSSFFHPVANYAAMYLAPLLVLTTGAILWKSIDRRWWWAVGVMATALTLTVSFGGYLAVGVGALVLLLRWPDQRQRRRAMFILGAAAVIGLAVLTRTPYLAEKFNTTDRSSSLVRTQIWRTSVEMIKDHPVFGVGPNAYEPVYRKTIPELYWPPLEWLVAQPHNLWLALWLETGVLGLVVFLAFLVMWSRSLWPRWRRGEAAGIVAIASMSTLIIHGFVDTPIFKNDLALMFVFVTFIPSILTAPKNKLTE